MIQSTLLSRAAVLAALFCVWTCSIAAAQPPPVPAGPRLESAQGKMVRVTGTDGARRSGRLTSITSTAVVVHERGQDVSMPLTGVRRVEKVGHGVRDGALGGAVAGFIYGYGVTEEDGAGSSREVVGGLLLAGLGAAAGAGVGALLNRARRGGNLIYENRVSSTSVSIAPVLSPSGHVGLAVVGRW